MAEMIMLIKTFNMKKATITITPDNPDNFLDCQTGDCTNFDMLHAVQILSQHFAKKIINDYKHLTGDRDLSDPKQFDEWVKFLQAEGL